MKTRTFFLVLGLAACAVFFRPQVVSAHGPGVVYRGNNVSVRVVPGYGYPSHYAPYVRHQRPSVVIVTPPKRVLPPPVIYYAPTPQYYRDYRATPYLW